MRDIRGAKAEREGPRRGRRSIPSPTEEEEERRRREASGSPDLSSGDDASTPRLPLVSPTRRSTSQSGASSALVPYGVPALERVFVLLVELINPTGGGTTEQQQHEKEADRVLGLRLIRTVLETAVSPSSSSCTCADVRKVP